MTADLHLEKHRQEVLQQAIPQKNVTENNSQTSDEIRKEEMKQSAQNTHKFAETYQTSQQPLISLKSVFPFDFFPDSLVVDPLKVNYTHQIFFYSSFTESIPISDITNVVVEESIIFATLRISFISYPTRQIYIKPLWKQDAERAREIVAGLMVANREKIEMGKIRIQNPEVIARIGT